MYESSTYIFTHILAEKTSGIFSEDFTKIEVSFSLEKLEEKSLIVVIIDLHN